MFIRRCILAASFVAATALPATASTMPRADFSATPTLSIGGGQGVGIAVDVPLDSAWSLGGSAGSSVGFAGGAGADLRALYRFWWVGRNPVTLAGLLGAQAFGPAFSSFTAFSPVVGVAAAYPLTSQWSARLNLVVSVLGGVGVARSSGFEIGYEFFPNMEATLGYNGRGDYLGLKIQI